MISSRKWSIVEYNKGIFSGGERSGDDPFLPESVGRMFFLTYPAYSGND
jgi:hypothetical protein